MHALACQNCGGPFTARNANARTCGPTCRSAARRARDAALHALAVELLLADAEPDAYDPGDPKSPDWLDRVLDARGSTAEP